MNEDEYRRFLTILLPVVPAIVPCAPGSKIPAIKWKDHPPGVTTPDLPGTTARALLTGSRSGGIVVLDVDTSGDGFRTLEALENRLGLIPATLTVRSPSGGLHIYLRDPDSRFKTQAKALGPGLDVRGEGGIVLCAGSRHPRGGHYTIEDIPPAL